MAKKRKPVITNPLTQWLLTYIERHDTNLTEMSLQAGLSSGSLRSLVRYPERKPSLETCIRLAQVTDKSPEEIAQLAGLDILPNKQLHPDRIELLQAFDNLPSERLRQAMVNMAKAVSELNQEQC